MLALKLIVTPILLAALMFLEGEIRFAAQRGVKMCLRLSQHFKPFMILAAVILGVDRSLQVVNTVAALVVWRLLMEMSVAIASEPHSLSALNTLE